MSEQGWLIEAFIGAPVWFRIAECNRSKWTWTVDASKAVRFSRQQDAEQMLAFLRGLSVLDERWKVTGHEWVDSPAVVP
jgi:hypothetical protein